MHLARLKSSTPLCNRGQRPKLTRKLAVEAEVANRKITKMEVVRGHPMAGQMGTLLPPIAPLENEGGLTNGWIRSLSVPKKAVRRVSPELSTCEHYYEFPLPEAATDSSHLK
jgi:hypothetical protein